MRVFISCLLVMLCYCVVSQDIRTTDEILLELKEDNKENSVSLLIELCKASRFEGKADLYRSSVNKAMTLVRADNYKDKPLKLTVFNEKAWQLKAEAEFDSALLLLREAEAIAEEGTQLQSDLFHTRASIFYNVAQYDSAIAYNLKALEIRHRLEDLEGLAISYNNLSNAYDRKSDYPKSIDAAFESLKIREQLGHKSQMADVYSNLGGTYNMIGEYDKAIEMLLTGISLLEEIAAPIANASASWANLGVTYVSIQEYEKAIDAFNRVLAIQKEVGNKYHIAFALEGLAVVFEEQLQFDSSLSYHQRGLKIARELDDPFSIGRRLMGMGVAYEKLDRFEESRAAYEESLTVRQEIGDKKGVANNYINLGYLFLRTDELNGAIDHFEKALDMTDELIIERSKAYEGLYLVHKEARNFSKSLANFEAYKALNDSLINADKLENIAELETRYETEKKEREIELLNKEKELQAAELQRNQLMLSAATGLIVLIVVIAFILYRQRDLKAKARLVQEKAKLKTEQIQAVIASQEKERKRFAMDLHDDFGQLISALKLNVSRIEATSSQVTKSEEILDSMYSSLKNIAFDLMPHTLFERGLEEAIDELKEQVSASGEIQMSFQPFGIRDKINDDQKVAVYRIVQELVSNTIKYAGATKINISITDLEEGFSLMLEDNGNGYNVEDFKNGSGNGWKNIRSRLDLLQGEIDFDTTKGRKNATVSIEIPYRLVENVAVAS